MGCTTLAALRLVVIKRIATVEITVRQRFIFFTSSTAIGLLLLSTQFVFEVLSRPRSIQLCLCIYDSHVYNDSVCLFSLQAVYEANVP